MFNSAGACPLALCTCTDKKTSDDRPRCLENPRREGAESTLTENAASPFSAEPAHPDSEITVDSPIPFSIRDLWYYFDRQERATFADGQCTTEMLIQEGAAATLTPAAFHPYSPMNTAPFRNKAAIG